ncbi:MAG: Spy/CpxP family protein refolding chaperone [Saprospiraceae bacterium]|nr:Spy/CpxP family protein refolding chaperone [Saprospiraceae bacterium]
MKKGILISLIVLIVAAVNAQPPGPPGPPGEKNPKMEKRIESMRIAFITKELNLTPSESQAFWPVFNEMKDREKALREQMKPDKPVEELTEQEANTVLDQQMNLMDKEVTLRREYTERFRKILPATKVLKLQHAEGEFRRQLVNEVKERRSRKERPGRK